MGKTRKKYKSKKYKKYKRKTAKFRLYSNKFVKYI